MTESDIPGGGVEAPRRVDALRRLWPYLRPYGTVLAGASLALVVAAGTVLALGAGLRLLVDQGFQSQDPVLLDRALIVLLLVVVVLAVASYARFSLVSWLGERVVADLRKDVQAHLLRLSPAYFELTDAGALVSRLTADTTLVQTVVGSSVSFALRNALMFVGATVLLVITSPRLTGLVFLVLPVVVVPILVFGRRVRRLSRDSQDRLADVGTRLDEAVGAIKIVQAFNQEGAEATRFAAAVEAAFAAAKKRIHARALLTASVMLLVFGAISTVLWLGGRDVIDGRISPGELSAFIFYAAVMAASIGTLSEVFGDLQRAAGAVERLLSVLDTDPEITAPPRPSPLPEPSRGEISFEAVRFAYPARPDVPILDRLALAVTPGETVALVGRSGAGKTTLFQLLLRFYDPGAGAVRLDGVDLRNADPAAVRDRIALVAQEPVLFSGSIGDNIRYGRPDAGADAVWRAAEAADAAEFIGALPQGLDTQLGHRGIRLSGGQRQRLAIARALLRDPAVLLLDEPTSALDAESDRAVRAALQRLMAGRTTLIIAHRLSTVRQADRIVVLDGGRIVAEGSHDQLMRGDGLYARLADLQFAEVAADATAAQ